MQLSVSTASGETRQIALPAGATWQTLQEKVAEELDIPAAFQVYSQGDQVVKIEKQGALSGDAVHLDDVLMVTRLDHAWIWADEQGCNPFSDPRDLPPCQFEHMYKGLRDLFAWVDDQNGEDSGSDDVVAGVVYLPSQGIPSTSQEMLHFLSGSDGAHAPVGGFAFGEDEEADEKAEGLTPWVDVASFSVGKIPEFWPPKERKPNSHCSRGYDQIMHAPSLLEATRALVCAGKEATESEVMEMAAACIFFAVIDTDACEASRTHLKEERQYFTEPICKVYIIVCANPQKSTIAFSYQASYHI
eukprot:TRINITY_DN83254_c0_g1_i1.p1 TRINITY_DN83254_c0_g1~~TRINITY_DN83254_c0_g1_i1.p1  ORF type:complete len:302 (-),score=41.14 TRINITY_DN83254_c0_g1_i1:160-1065(-)